MAVKLPIKAIEEEEKFLAAPCLKFGICIVFYFS